MAYIESHKNQSYLIPQNMRDLFSKEHVCYLIEQIAEELDYSEFDNKYKGVGHPAYHPRIPIKLLLMAYIDGIRSSRRIAKNACENVVYICLAEKTNPDFRTISDFRKNNKDLVKGVFKNVNDFAVKRGLIDLSHLMIDGSSIEANNNRYRVIDRETLEKLNKYVDEIIEEDIKRDEEEDKLYGERGMHQLPDDLNTNEKRKIVVNKIVKEINKSAKNGDIKQTKATFENTIKRMDEQKLKEICITDIDSRWMKNKKNRVEPSYNAQIVSDNNGLIISNNVTQAHHDSSLLVPNIQQVEEHFGPLAKGTKISADNGYMKSTAIEELDNRGFDLYVPGKNSIKEDSKDKKFAKANFIYDEDKDIFICPERQILTPRSKYIHKQSKQELTIYRSCAEQCAICTHKLECCKKAKTKTIHAYPQEKLINRIQIKLNTEEGRAIYDHRQETVERSFADIKEHRKFRRFLVKGLDKTKIEWNLVCSAHNIVLINNLIRKKKPNIKQKQKTTSEKQKILNILATAC